MPPTATPRFFSQEKFATIVEDLPQREKEVKWVGFHFLPSSQCFCCVPGYFMKTQPARELLIMIRGKKKIPIFHTWTHIEGPVSLSLPEDMIVDFRERREGQREGSTNVRENHQLMASRACPNRGPNLQPRHVP